MLLDKVTDAMYELYKPKFNPFKHKQQVDPKTGQPMADNPNSSKTEFISPKSGRIKNTSPQSQSSILDKAHRLNTWANTASDSALRIFEELTGMSKVANIDLAKIKMGIDTEKEPDSFGKTTDGKDLVLESKRADSSSQGAVDRHITASSKQLAKRDQYYNSNGTKIDIFVANIFVASPENTWPYTPTQFHQRLAQKKFSDFPAVLKGRIETYKSKSGAKISINYQVHLANPNLPTDSHVMV